MAVVDTESGVRIVTAHVDGALTFWNPAARSHVTRRLLQSGKGWHTVCEVDDGLVVSDAHPDGLATWSAATAETVDVIRISGNTHLYAAGKLGSTAYAMVADWKDHSVDVWNLTTREPVGDRLTLHRDAAPYSACFARLPNGTLAVFIGVNSRLVPSHEPGLRTSVRNLLQWPAEVQDLPEAGWGPHCARTVTDERGCVLSIGGADGTLKRFVCTDDRFTLAADIAAHDGAIDVLSFCSEGGTHDEISGGRDGVIRRVAADCSPASATSWPTMGPRSHILVNSAGDRLLVGLRRNGSLDRWRIDTGECLGPPPRLASWLSACTMTSTSAAVVHGRPAVVVGTTSGTIVALDPRTGDVIERIHTVEGAGIRALQVEVVGDSQWMIAQTERHDVALLELGAREESVVSMRPYGDSGQLWDIDLVTAFGTPTVFSVGQRADGPPTVDQWSLGSALEHDRSFPASVDGSDSLLRIVTAGLVDGEPVIVAMGDGSCVKVWSLRTAEVVREGILDDGHRMATHHLSIESVCGSDVIVSGGYAGALSFWNPSGTINRTIDVGHSTSGWQVLPDSGDMIVGGARGMVCLSLNRDWLRGVDR